MIIITENMTIGMKTVKIIRKGRKNYNKRDYKSKKAVITNGRVNYNKRDYKIGITTIGIITIGEVTNFFVGPLLADTSSLHNGPVLGTMR